MDKNFFEKRESLFREFKKKIPELLPMSFIPNKEGKVKVLTFSGEIVEMRVFFCEKTNMYRLNHFFNDCIGWIPAEYKVKKKK